MRNEQDWIERTRDAYLKKFYPPRIREVLQSIPDPIDLPSKIESQYIYGPVNSGKTIYAAQLMLQEQKNIYMEDGPKTMYDHCRFVTIPELFQEIKDTFSNNSTRTERQVIDSYSAVHLLVLDDFATVKPTDWVLQTLYLIINHRYDFLKKTIFTSNVSLEGASKFFGDDRITSRIDRMCLVVQKDDWRKK